jgi:hypothetical protein
MIILGMQMHLIDKAFERVSLDKGNLSSRELPKPAW